MADINFVDLCVKKSFEPYVSILPKPPAPLSRNYKPFIESNTLFLIITNNKPSGFICFHHELSYLKIDTVAVLPLFQGNSLGKKLLEFADEYAYKNEFNEIRLSTNQMMSKNISIYKYYGYKEYDRRVENGYSRVFLKRNI